MIYGVSGVSNYSWVLSPISFGKTKTPQYPEYSKPFDSPSSFNSRTSTDNIPPFSPLSNSVDLMFATPPPTAKYRKSRGKFWKAIKQFLTCYNPLGSNPESVKSSRKDKSAAASKSSSVHSVRASPQHAYSAMNDEERNESLKAVITYCNKSMERRAGDQSDGDDSRVEDPNLIRGG